MSDTAIRTAIRDRKELTSRVEWVRIAAVLLCGLAVLEAVSNIVVGNTLGAILALTLLSIPYCAFTGIKERRRGCIVTFTVANSFCGCCYIVLVVLLALLVIPAIVSNHTTASDQGIDVMDRTVSAILTASNRFWISAPIQLLNRDMGGDMRQLTNMVSIPNLTTIFPRTVKSLNIAWITGATPINQPGYICHSACR